MIAVILLCLALLTQSSESPTCWEDEATVMVVDYTVPPGDDKPRIGELGCVPLDNLPVSGYRP